MSVGKTKINPLEYLNNNPFLKNKVTVEFDYNSINYKLYFEDQNLFYATNSIFPYERLERHLKSLSHQISALKGIWPKIKNELENITNQEYHSNFPIEYDLIIWLLKKQYLNAQQLSILGQKLSQEIFEGLLLINDFDVQKIKISDHKLINICHCNFNKLIDVAKNNLQKWQKFTPEIQSPYQRPTLAINQELVPENQKLSPATHNTLAKILRGFNFKELSAILNQDEIKIAEKLYPLIKQKIVILKNPKSDFDLIPKLVNNIPLKEINTDEKKKIDIDTQIQQQLEQSEKFNNVLSSPSTKIYKIACIDDSPIILKSIANCLNQDNITLFPINNAAKAMMVVNSVKPDLIFMDIGMPVIDGYQLCSLLRKNEAFREIPIIMLTGNKGIINRAKAKMAGATDFMTKPFTQDDLLEVIFRYLSDS